MGFGGGLRCGEVGAHEREEAAELHAVHGVSGAHGPLAREVGLHFHFPTGGLLVAVVARAEEALADGEEGVELSLGAGADAEGVVFRDRLEAGDGGVDTIVQEIESQAGLVAFAGARESGPTAEFKAHAVGEE